MKVSAGPYLLDIPPNGVAILYEADPGGSTGVCQVPGGVGYLDALIQFAGEVVRLRALLEAVRVTAVEAALADPDEPHCSSIPVDWRREAECRQGYHWDDGVPYCDTCGLYRGSVARKLGRPGP